MPWPDVSVCYGHPAIGRKSAKELLGAMDAAGVQRAWIFGYEAAGTHDFTAANREIAGLVKSHPDRFVPIGLVNPLYQQPELDRLIGEGFRGVKILTGWGNWLTIDNARRTLIPLAETLHGRDCHLSVALEGHFPGRGGSVFLPLVIRESGTNVCLVVDRCHSVPAWEDYLTLARDDKSLWVTVSALPQRLLERIVKEIGIHRLLLGSWYPETDADLVHMAYQRATGLGDGIDGVLTENADRVLKALSPRLL